MSTFEKLNQRGVVIICTIIHCGNGLREVLKSCYKITPALFSAHLIEGRFEICITKCQPVSPSNLSLAHSTKQPSVVNNDSQHGAETLECSLTAHTTHIFSTWRVSSGFWCKRVSAQARQRGGNLLGISSVCVCVRVWQDVRWSQRINLLILFC